jgi:hypothetical protein
MIFRPAGSRRNSGSGRPRWPGKPFQTLRGFVPHLFEWFPGPRGRPDPETRGFPAGPQIMFKNQSVISLFERHSATVNELWSWPPLCVLEGVHYCFTKVCRSGRPPPPVGDMHGPKPCEFIWVGGMAPNSVKSQGLVACMAPNFINSQGLVACMAPTPMNSQGLVTCMAPPPPQGCFRTIAAVGKS